MIAAKPERVPVFEESARTEGHPLRTARSARFGTREKDVCAEGLVPVQHRKALGRPKRQKSRVRPAVMAHGQRAIAQVDDLHHMGLTALPAQSVIMVAPVRCLGSAGCHLSHG